MHSNNIFIKLLRWLLLPFSLLYGCVVMLRNFFYDKKILRSATFDLPVICIGNLSVGGTGKSPMSEYLIRLLKSKYKVAVLSRGYGRKTKGYLLADDNSTAQDIGDEPMQFRKLFPEITVAVGEKRVEAIPQLLYDEPQTQLIILDDAFQHREIVAGLNILLTEYHHLYSDDFFLPTGYLRDEKKSANRANIIVVTKSDKEATDNDKKRIERSLNIKTHQHLFLSALSYELPEQLFTKENTAFDKSMDVLLVTAIANPASLIAYLNTVVKTVSVNAFSDHHHYTKDDVQKIVDQFVKIENQNKLIIVTSKDAVKLKTFSAQLQELPIYVIPVRHEILLNEKEAFDNLILRYVEKTLIQ